MRSVRKRTKSGQPVGVGRKYIYAKHLFFLQESMALAATQSSTEDPSLDSPLSQADQDEESSSDPVASSDPATPGPTCGVSRTTAKRRQELESSLIQFMNTPVIVEPPDSNRSFFDSLIPMIKNFTEDQTLQFRSEVIELIRRIKRQSMVPPETHTTVSNPTQPSLLIPPINYRFPSQTYNPIVQQRQQSRQFYQPINFPSPQQITPVFPMTDHTIPMASSHYITENTPPSQSSPCSQSCSVDNTDPDNMHHM